MKIETMKLRTDGDSIRLRLRRSEVAGFAAGGSISKTIPFASRPLRFSLETGGESDIAASFDGQTVRITVSAAAAHQWAESAQTGIYGTDNGISLAVEKDFRRTTRATPDDDDLYPNPASKREG
jgi:hypothetical protein